MNSREPDDLSHLHATWPGTSCLAVANRERVLGAGGDTQWSTRIASVSKLFTCYAALISIEEGSISLDDPAGQTGSTVRHLLAHASGMGFADPTPLFAPGTRRVYSNVGIEALAAHIADRAGMDFADYLSEAVISPLELHGFDHSGSPAHGMSGSVDHLIRFGQELLNPTLIDRSTLDAATTPVYPQLRGVLPGFGSADPNPWGLGFEIRGNKDPHWTGASHDPSTFGHFGGSGSFLWVDPTRQLVGASLCSTPFGEWAVTAWPHANEALLDTYS